MKIGCGIEPGTSGSLGSKLSCACAWVGLGPYEGKVARFLLGARGSVVSLREQWPLAASSCFRFLEEDQEAAGRHCSREESGYFFQALENLQSAAVAQSPALTGFSSM